MCLVPFHDLAQLVQVFHIGEVQIFHRRAADDHTVIAAVSDLVECGKRFQMVAVDVLRPVTGCLEQFDLDLKRSVGKVWWRSCVSVVIFVGIRLRTSRFSGRMSGGAPDVLS